jgi:molybdopterin converting factor small subunit
MAIISIPPPMRPWTGGQRELVIDGGTVGEVFKRFRVAHPEAVAMMVDRFGRPGPYVNIFVRGEEIEFLQGFDTPVGPDEAVIIVPGHRGG